jgi:hypothetical protein
MAKKKVLRAAGNTRYGSYLSVGRLLGIKASGLQNAIKVQFIPQWEEQGQTEAVLSKRSLLVDVGVSDANLDDIKKVARLAEQIKQASLEHPDTLLAMVNAFGRSGSKPEREKTLERAESLSLWQQGDSEPTASWIGLLLIGVAIFISACCQETDTECDTDTDTDTD